jgi:hypothetical protein
MEVKMTVSDIGKNVSWAVEKWLDKLSAEGDIAAEKITGFMYLLSLGHLDGHKPGRPLNGKFLLTYLNSQYVVSYECNGGQFIQVIGKIGMPGGGQDGQ